MHTSPLFCIAFACLVGSAVAQTPAVPAPAGLVPCDPRGALVRGMQATLSMFGHPLACYTSTESWTLQGPGKKSVPREYAFAIDVNPAFGPYSRSDVDAMYAKVSEQWRTYQPADRARLEEYTRSVNAALAKSLPQQPAANLQLQPPLLVSIERVGIGAYLVVSIRKRTFTAPGGAQYASTAVEAAGMALRGSSLVRIEVHREMAGSSDVAIVHDGADAWLKKLTQ